MEYSRIEELLNRYLEGESTLEEEALLKGYLSQAEVLPEHLEMQEMFRYFARSNQEMTSTSDITHDLTELIEQEWKMHEDSLYKSNEKMIKDSIWGDIALPAEIALNSVFTKVPCKK